MRYNKYAKQNQITFKDKRPIFVGGLIPIPIFASQMILGKNACSADLHMVFIREVGFVWRQLECAFFGAVNFGCRTFYFIKFIGGFINEKNIINFTLRDFVL